MSSPPSKYDFFVDAAVSAVEAAFGWEVASHPRGGFTFAKSTPGTSIRTYFGSFPTRKIADAELAKMKAEEIRKYMAERHASVHHEKPAEGKPEQLSIRLEPAATDDGPDLGFP